MTDSLAPALALASSRLSPPPTPARSALIHGAVLAAWLTLFVLAFGQGGVFAWSVGLAYIAYDTALQVFVGWQTWRLLRPAATPQAVGARCRLSVIVAVHNEAAVLPATIAALLAQSDGADEIVIADDGSTDSTPGLLVERYGLALPSLGAESAVREGATSLVWLRLPHGGKARALNAAILRTGTDIVLTVDGDTLLDERAVAAVRRAFSAEPALAGITGVITPVCRSTFSGRCLEWFQTYEYIRNFLSRYAWMRLDSLLLISGAFAGFRRAAVVEVGGFDPACLVEDYELIHRLRRHAVD
ncbi:MAG: glycosyltransferase family 2 protein, partial [Caldimonas sp.]